MADYKIPIDTFIRETFECMTSVCAIFSGAALSFQNTRMHTRRNSTDLQIMAGSTLLTIPLNSIVISFGQHFPCNTSLIPKEHLLHLVDVVFPCPMVIAQNSFFTNTLICIRCLQKVILCVSAYTVAKCRFKCIICFVQLCFQFTSTLSAQVQFASITLILRTLTPNFLNHFHWEPLFNKDMFDSLILDINAIVEHCRCKKNPLQKLSVSDTITQTIHSTALVVA